MRAAFIPQFGPPSVLEVRDVPTPAPGPGEILVRVRASALNRADLLQRMGRYPPPPSAPRDIPGIEFAGEVAATGPGAARWAVGDRVFAVTAGGAHAEFCTAHEDTVVEVPSNLTWAEAGAIPEAFITAHDALVTQAGLRAGETVLIHAVGSGVGLAATQLARALGARPFGTSRTADKVARAAAFGLAGGAVVTGPEVSLGAEVSAWTGDRGIDVVLDLVGGPWVAASIAVMAPHGRLMLVGTMGGTEATLDLRRMLGRRLTVRGTVLRARPLEEKVAVARAFARDVVPLLASGAARPVIDSVFSLAEIVAAHERVESNATFGKVVLELPGG